MLLGGLALALLVGPLLWLLAPRGVRIDAERRVVTTWRGRLPRVLRRETPFDGIERIRVRTRRTRSETGSTRVYDYYLDTKDDGAIFITTRSKLAERVALKEQLVSALGVPVEEG